MIALIHRIPGPARRMQSGTGMKLGISKKLVASSSVPGTLLLGAMLSACAAAPVRTEAAAPSVALAGPTGVTERMPSSDDNPVDETRARPALLPEQAVVGAADRDDADRAFDASRQPAELLRFMGVAPGMRVAVLVAGAGYTAELLARAVAPGGTVYAVNPSFGLPSAGAEDAWASRLAKPAMSNVVRVDRELDDPLPKDATGLDLVVINLVYHDAVWLGVDRWRMNGAVFRALRPGGKYVVIDRSARPGDGFADVRTLHRIDESALREEVQRTGFWLADEGAFLRNPSDSLDSSVPPGLANDTSDRFVFKFLKP